MLGWRGASRYYSDDYRAAFALECRALRRVRGEMGFTNVIVMVPFCRTPDEADRVLEVMGENGLERGENGLKVWSCPRTSSRPTSSLNASTGSPSARTTSPSSASASGATTTASPICSTSATPLSG